MNKSNNRTNRLYVEIKRMQTTFPEARRIAVLVHSAIAGAGIAATFALISRETLGTLLLIALGCFAVAIPSAIALVILSQVIYEMDKQPVHDSDIQHQNWPAMSYVLAVVDQLSCYCGFLVLFWYFHWGIGAIFLFTTVLAFITTWMAEKSMPRKSS